MRLSSKKIVVTGGGGFLGGYVVAALKAYGATNTFVPRSKDYDLRLRNVAEKVVSKADIVIHLAAQIGGIGFIGEHPGEIFYNNAIMGIELMEAARKAGVEKFVSIGTVCEYPKSPPLPFREKDLWEGYPEETTASYGWAKKILIAQGEAYRKQYGFHAIHLLPVNLYGPGDNFNRVSAHVIPTLIRRITDARNNQKKTVEVWGSGKATREFLYVEDAAKGVILATMKYDDTMPLNLGTGIETSIREVTELIMKLSGYKGSITWNTSKPDGQPRRQLDVTRAKKLIGFTATTSLSNGLAKTIEWYERHKV